MLYAQMNIMRTQSRILLLLAITLTALGTAAVAVANAAAPPRLLINYGRPFLARPAAIIVGNAQIGGTSLAASIKWTRWGATEATGHGRAKLPNGVKAPAQIRASRVQDGRFTRLFWSYTQDGELHREWDRLARFHGKWSWHLIRAT